MWMPLYRGAPMPNGGGALGEYSEYIRQRTAWHPFLGSICRGATGILRSLQGTGTGGGGEVMMISFSPCGCAFNPFTRMIVFCPLHAAAPLMLEALRKLPGYFYDDNRFKGY